MKRKIWLLVVLLGFLTVSRVAAQEELPGVWNAPKIKGIRFLPDATYQGNPFLNDVFTAGEINLMDGTKIVDVQLKYNNYRDELIYYNADITTQILVDKISVSSFSLADERGDKHFYIKQTVNLPYHPPCHPIMRFPHRSIRHPHVVPPTPTHRVRQVRSLHRCSPIIPQRSIDLPQHPTIPSQHTMPA